MICSRFFQDCFIYSVMLGGFTWIISILQSYVIVPHDWLNACEAIVNDIGKTDQYQTRTKHKKANCVYNSMSILHGIIEKDCWVISSVHWRYNHCYMIVALLDGFLNANHVTFPVNSRGRSPEVVAPFLLQTLVAIWFDFVNCMIQSKWNQIIQDSTITIII